MPINPLELPIRLDVFDSTGGWRQAGEIDLHAIEEDVLVRLTRTEKGWLNDPIIYYRCLSIENDIVEQIQAKLIANEPVYCRIAVDVQAQNNHHFEMAIRVREVYQCSVAQGDGAVDPSGIPLATLRWMITGLHFPTHAIN